MSARSALEIKGLGYDWLACDVDGAVGLLSTAGGGIVPAAALAGMDDYDDAIDAILRLPVLGEPIHAPTMDGVNTWRAVAERGLYAYDASPAGSGAYGREAVPRQLLLLDDLPTVIRPIVMRHRFDVRFADAMSLAPASG